MAKKVVKKTKDFGLTPLGDRVILEELKDSVKETSSGIYIPDSVKEDKGTKKGRVVAVGKGKYDDGKLVPMGIKVGDAVLYQWGDVITYQGDEYTIVRESEIVAVIK
jgi:chaperonin GroES